MSKFILIDHSIMGLSGHHYEYALHVLRAAKQEGYTPVLATNRRFKDTTDIPWEVYPIYKYGFWFRLTAPSWYWRLKRASSAVKGRIIRLKVQLAFSHFGFFWSIRNQAGKYIQRRNLNIPLQISLYILMGLFYCVHAVAISLRMLHRRAMSFGDYMGGFFKGFRGFAKVFFSPIIVSFWLKGWILRWLYDCVRMKQFGRDSLKLFQLAPLQEGDIVFIPTISFVEMKGLLFYFRKDSNSSKATWHMLFRRNLYNGRDPDYSAQDGMLRPIRAAFKGVKNHLGGQKIYLYTDTEELTAQYNRLAVMPFRTLPIPHTQPPADYATSEEAPIRIIYAGDARAEKGYHHLPRIVKDLWEDYVRTDKVVFVFQSNYNNPEGEPEAIIARSQLECYPDDKVRLLKKPLSSEEYRRLIASGGVNLLLYNPDDYYARSSGIFIESLAAGVPVIVPAGTWMARQLVDEIYLYHESLRQTMKVLESRLGAEIRWQRHDKPELYSAENGQLVFGPGKQEAYCSPSVPDGSTHVLASFKLSGNASSTLALIDVVQLSIQGDLIGSLSRIVEKGTTGCSCSVLVPIKRGAAKIRLGFKNAFSGYSVRIYDIHIDFLSSYESSEQCPLGAVGLTYSKLDEVPDLLRNMIDNHPHYRDTARAFAGKIYLHHNAARLIKELKHTTEAASSI